MTTLSENETLAKRLGGRNLYLVGMMGSGKTTTGIPLAKMLNYKFIDLDQIIEKSTQKSVSKIFEEDGEQIFREAEHLVLNEIGQHHSLIVATGGGIVKNSENWGILHQGIVIWLKVTQSNLLKRLSQDNTPRPLLDSRDKASKLKVLMEERELFYAEADLHILINNETPLEVAQEIIMQLPSILNVQDVQF